MRNAGRHAEDRIAGNTPNPWRTPTQSRRLAVTTNTPKVGRDQRRSLKRLQATPTCSRKAERVTPTVGGRQKVKGGLTGGQRLLGGRSLGWQRRAEGYSRGREVARLGT